MIRLGRAECENIWRRTRSLRRDRELNIFPSGPITATMTTKALYLVIRVILLNP